MASFHVWVSELRTLDVQVEAPSREEAERYVRRGLASHDRDNEWVTTAIVIKVAAAESARAAVATEPSEHRRKLLTTGAAAGVLGIGRTTIYALIKSGDLKTVAIGRRRLVSEEDLTDYIATHSD